MHDTLGYLEREPVHRRFHQNDLTFRGLYLGSERWVLPLSHDEVVHGKGSLLAKMPGDDWQRRAALRLLYGYQWGSLGAKLLFMGGELGQHDEWSHTRSLDWHLQGEPAHAGLGDWLRALNGLYRSHPSLEDHGDSFWWIACVDSENSVFAWARQLPGGGNQTVWVANFTPVPRPGYRIGLPEGGRWRLLLNGDDTSYGGSGHPVVTETEAEAAPWDGQPQSAVLTLPPLAISRLRTLTRRAFPATILLPMEDRRVTFRSRTVLTVLAIAVGAGVVLWTVWLARSVIIWALIALFLAMALNPAVEWLRERGVKRRGHAVAIVYVGALLLIAGIGAAFVPTLVREVNDFVAALPGYVEDLTKGKGRSGSSRRSTTSSSESGRRSRRAAPRACSASRRPRSR